MPINFHQPIDKDDAPRERLIADFISGMTDRYAYYYYGRLFEPGIGSFTKTFKSLSWYGQRYNHGIVPVTAYRLRKAATKADGSVLRFPYSLKLAQIRVENRVAQGTAHGNDLAFVMKGMRQDMMKDERRGADGDPAIGEMKLRIDIESLIGQGRQIGVGRLVDFLLQESYVNKGRAVLMGPVGVP
jgi:Phosphohydrolase-associated domain